VAGSKERARVRHREVEGIAFDHRQLLVRDHGAYGGAAQRTRATDPAAVPRSRACELGRRARAADGTGKRYVMQRERMGPEVAVGVRGLAARPADKPVVAWS
jgi:hypothetical protein